MMKIRVPTILTVVVLGVVTWASLYGWAFVQLYRAPHSYEVASLWIYENIPAGSKLLGPHWDDRLPVDLPGYNPHQYEYECRECELPFYEPDNLATLETLIRRIATGDYIIFPTPRIQGSIMRIPEEYPRTTALLQLLWNGQLGYQIEHVVKEEPKIFGIGFNDDLADESFSVYDHPKVTILKNVGKLSPQEIRSRVLNAEAYGPLPTLHQILRTNSIEDIGRYGAPKSTIFKDLLTVLLVIILAAVVGAQFLSKSSCSKRHRGFVTSLLFSPVLFGFVLGGLGWLLPINLGDSAVRTVYFVTVILALVFLLTRLNKDVDSGNSSRSFYGFSYSYLGTLAVFMLSGLIAGYSATFLSSVAGGVVGDLSALLAIVRRASSGTVGIEFGIGQSSFPLVPFLLPLLWPLKVVGVEVSHTFVVVQALCASILGALFYRFIFLCSSLKTKSWCVVSGALSLILSLAFVQGSIFYIIPKFKEVDRSEYGRTEREVEELKHWTAEKTRGSPIFIEGAPGASSLLVSQLGLPSFIFTPFGPKLVRQDIKTLLYETRDVEQAYKIASENQIQLIVIGTIERKLFSKESLEKFTYRPDLFAKVYGGKEVVIYAPATSPVFTASF